VDDRVNAFLDVAQPLLGLLARPQQLQLRLRLVGRDGGRVYDHMKSFAHYGQPDAQSL
jgi:hypothetical protein